ncbi:hypothetical protein EVG20_g8009 [Dentipellis fragilis]|uniref:Uncharacterized protein n=1 Tax=Dentipellis fragilis TaxID=205917 RepID=A0A4Y9YAQ1_9AGAM|nr:hypothetical protein EVG20_g8009 [Dentipellis fragilis]
MMTTPLGSLFSRDSLMDVVQPVAYCTNVYVSPASAYKIISPTEHTIWTLTGPKYIAWTRHAYDSGAFVVTLSNHNRNLFPQDGVIIAERSKDSIDASGLILIKDTFWENASARPGGGYYVHFAVDRENRRTLYAQAGPFRISNCTDDCGDFHHRTQRGTALCRPRLDLEEPNDLGGDGESVDAGFSVFQAMVLPPSDPEQYLFIPSAASAYSGLRCGIRAVPELGREEDVCAALGVQREPLALADEHLTIKVDAGSVLVRAAAFVDGVAKLVAPESTGTNTFLPSVQLPTAAQPVLQWNAEIMHVVPVDSANSDVQQDDHVAAFAPGMVPNEVPPPATLPVPTQTFIQYPINTHVLPPQQFVEPAPELNNPILFTAAYTFELLLDAAKELQVIETLPLGLENHVPAGMVLLPNGILIPSLLALICNNTGTMPPTIPRGCAPKNLTWKKVQWGEHTMRSVHFDATNRYPIAPDVLDKNRTFPCPYFGCNMSFKGTDKDIGDHFSQHHPCAPVDPKKKIGCPLHVKDIIIGDPHNGIPVRIHRCRVSVSLRIAASHGMSPRVIWALTRKSVSSVERRWRELQWMALSSWLAVVVPSIVVTPIM